MRETMQYDNFVMKVLSTANTIGKILLTSGAETYRVEKAISTICRRFDLKAETFDMCFNICKKKRWSYYYRGQ